MRDFEEMKEGVLRASEAASRKKERVLRTLRSGKK
jgi:hydrogenase maturation factor HypE